MKDIEAEHQKNILMKFNKFKMNDFMTWLFAITIKEVITKDDSFDVNSKPTLNDFHPILVKKYHFNIISDAAKSIKSIQEEVGAIMNNETTDKKLKKIFLDDLNGE